MGDVWEVKGCLHRHSNVSADDKVRKNNLDVDFAILMDGMVLKYCGKSQGKQGHKAKSKCGIDCCSLTKRL